MQAGEILAQRFRIIRPIGSGGIGEVFEAADLHGGPRCAVKVLRPRYAQDSRIRRRFMREARAVGRLKHPGVVRLLTYGVDDDTAFIAMELLQGRTLEALHAERPNLATITDIIDQSLAALAYSHARGVIHRDFKPANVFLIDGPQGLQVKLLDFGFARVEEDDDPDLTQVHRDAFGTPHYMAPEQASGEGPIGPHTDLYSVGAVIYELVCGAPPFTGPTAMAVAFKQLMEAAPPLRPRADLRVPEGLAAVVDQALSKGTRARYANATEMRRALAALRGGPAAAALARPPLEVVAPDPDVTVVSTLAGVVAPAEATTPVIVGREAEMSALWRHVRAACTAGQGAVVVVEAAEGMGGTQLVGWLRDQVAEGGWMQVVHGQPSREAQHGHGALRGALEALFGELPGDGAAAAEAVEQAAIHWHGGREGPSTVERAAISALTAYMRPGEAGAVPKGLRGDTLYKRIAGAMRLAARERPVLLIFDALGSGEPAVAGFLRCLAQEIAADPMPVLAVVTMAPTLDGPLRDATNLDQVGVGPMGVEALMDLLDEAAAIDAGLARQVALHAQGNPLFAVELLAELRQSEAVRTLDGLLAPTGQLNQTSWPKTLGETLLARALSSLDSLVDGAFIEQALLRLAVLGSSFDYGVGVDYLVRAGAPAARAEWALEALLQAQLLVEARDRRADRLHFAHRAFVLAAQSGAERRGEPVPLLHRLAAEAKEAWAGNHRVRVAADLAEHYQHANAPLRASGWLIQAAEAASDAGERAHASALLVRADGLLAEQPGEEAARRRAEVWLGLAGAAFEAGQFDRARTLLARVDKWTRQTRDLVVAARARILLAKLLLANGDAAQAARIFANAGKVAAGASEPKLQADARLGRARVALQMGRADVALSEFRAARDLLVPLGDPVAVAPAWLGIGGLVLEEGTASEARTALEAALDGYRRGEDWTGRARCHLLLAEVAQRHEGPGRVQAHLDEALAAFAGLGDRLGLARTHGRLARLHAEQGCWTQVQRHTQWAITGFEALEQGNELARLRRNVGALAVAAGEIQLARPLLKAGLEAATTPGASLVFEALAGWAAGAAGDLTAFRAHVQAAWNLGRGRPVIDPALAQALEGAARISADRGDARPAARLFMRAAEQYEGLREPGEADRLRRAAYSLDATVGVQESARPVRATPPPVIVPPVVIALAPALIPVAAPPVIVPPVMPDLSTPDLTPVLIPPPPQAVSAPINEENTEPETPDGRRILRPGKPVDRAIGRHLGNLQIVEQIASGGMGAIYRAEHTALGTPYAVKLLHASTAEDPTMVARFRREAVTCSRLRHPNVVFLTDFGLDPELGIYLVMEFLDGISLGELIDRERRLTLDRAIHLAEQICSALSAAHGFGIIHRDLKPENLMIVAANEGTNDGLERLKVLDFGIVRLQGKEAEKLTGAGLVLGTPEYMSPEQISGKTELVGPATDIYALGALLYEMLTGQPPFVGKTDFQILSRHLLDAVPHASLHRPDLDGTLLDGLITEMLAKEPGKRPISMEVVHERLQEARDELLGLGLVQGIARLSSITPNRISRLLDDLAVGAGPTSELAARLPELGDLDEALLHRTLWGVLQSELLEIGPGDSHLSGTDQRLWRLLSAALDTAEEPEGEPVFRVATQGLRAVLALSQPVHQKAIVLALQGLRSHPRFPEDLMPDWARVTSSGTWRLPGLPPERATGPLPGIHSSLAAKLGRPLSVEMVKSVLSHEFTLFGRRKPQ